MTLDPELRDRLHFLGRVIRREQAHLLTTDRRLFIVPFSTKQAVQLGADVDLAERVEAFVGRFGRLQDTLGDKLLPLLLRAVEEHPGTAIDNLERAERLGWLSSVDDWLTARRLRNQMIHEYIEDPAILSGALQAGHEFVPLLTATAEAMLAETDQRAGGSTPSSSVV